MPAGGPRSKAFAPQKAFPLPRLFLFVPKGFNTQEPAHRFAGEIKGEVVDSYVSNFYRNFCANAMNFH
jgi:hypothetical protein